MKILIVEDDDGVYVTFRNLLKDLGAEIFHAETWVQMQDAMRVQTFDAILLDLGLPDSGTYDTISKIHDLKMSAPSTAICVITGHPGQTREQAIQAGADDFLHKTSAMRPRTLIQLVANLIGKAGNSKCSQKVDNQMKIAEKATHTVIEQMKPDASR